MAVNFKAYKWVMLAPAAGVTDSITRQIAKKWGADACVTELISAEGLIRNHQKTRDLMDFVESERPIGIQLFGANPKTMAEATAIAAELNPDFIDLNCGCPARKVVGKNGGSSLLKDLDKLAEILTGMVKATDLPVTMKYRSGWDHESIVAVEVAQMAESLGVAGLCLHPRTRKQGFSGHSNWEHIAEVKQAVSIPVIGSGDIDSPEKAREMFEQTGCDSVMICRASFGYPWIFYQTAHYLETGELLGEPTMESRFETALEHLRLSIEKHGPYHGLVRMRNQLCWYLRGLPGVGYVRSRLVTLPSEAEVIELLYKFKQDLVEKGYGTGENREAFTGCSRGKN